MDTDAIQTQYDRLVEHDGHIEQLRLEIRKAVAAGIAIYDELNAMVPEGSEVTVVHGKGTAVLKSRRPRGFPNPTLDIVRSDPPRNGKRLEFGDDVSDEKIRRRKI